MIWTGPVSDDPWNCTATGPEGARCQLPNNDTAHRRQDGTVHHAVVSGDKKLRVTWAATTTELRQWYAQTVAATKPWNYLDSRRAIGEHPDPLVQIYVEALAVARQIHDEILRRGGIEPVDPYL